MLTEFTSIKKLWWLLHNSNKCRFAFKAWQSRKAELSLQYGGGHSSRCNFTYPSRLCRWQRQSVLTKHQHAASKPFEKKRTCDDRSARRGRLLQWLKLQFKRHKLLI